MTQRSHSITIRDVARQAGVSVATVSRYINHRASVSDKVAGRIQKVMEELDYAPQMAAIYLATRKTYTVGLLSNTYNYSFFGPLVGGLEAELKANGYNLLMSTYRIDAHNRATPPIGPHNTDGVMVFANTIDNERLAEWYGMEFPVVLIHHTAPSSIPIPYVTIENKLAARKLVDHLIESHGKRRIAFVHAPENDEDGHLREMGYRKSLENHSIVFDPRLVIRGDYDRQIARQAIKDILVSSHTPFDAIFASDDDIAVSVVGALNDAGMEVPDDIAVVGFDDQRFASLFIPPLTTIQAPTRDVGAIAARQLLKLLGGQPATMATVLPTKMIVRQSCGCPI